MNSEPKNDGFSLTEVLLAVGILAVGLIFIAGVFPVGIHFTTIATERTQAAVVADEAFAKIRLYGVNSTWLSMAPNDACFDFNDVSFVPLNPSEFAYPSTYTNITQKQYYWSALCRRVDPNSTSRLVQITVFISRKIGAGARYRNPANPFDNSMAVNYPVPVPVNVSATANPDELSINFAEPVEKTLINDGCTIADNATGQLYRVLERYPSPNDDTIQLDRIWEGGSPAWVWVVPPPVGGGRYPCISVFQKVIRF